MASNESNVSRFGEDGGTVIVGDGILASNTGTSGISFINSFFSPNPDSSTFGFFSRGCSTGAGVGLSFRLALMVTTGGVVSMALDTTTLGTSVVDVLVLVVVVSGV